MIQLHKVHHSPIEYSLSLWTVLYRRSLGTCGLTSASRVKPGSKHPLHKTIPFTVKKDTKSLRIHDVAEDI